MPSTSRANGVAAAPTATRAPPNRWQFVNISVPKKIQDKSVLSVVRSHAMRSIRRKQRLELINQHQKEVKTMVKDTHDTESGMTAEHSINPKPNDWFIGDNEDTEWFSILCETRSKLESMDLGLLVSRLRVENAAECDEYVQTPAYWQSHNEHDVPAFTFTPFMFRTSHTGGPRSLVGDGMLDPFNAMPVPCGANHNSHVLQHCTHFSATFPFWSRT